MDAQAFKDAYVKKVAGSFGGPELAAVVGVPNADGSGRARVQMDVPGMGDTEQASAVGVFGNQQLTGEALEFANEYGRAPYMGSMDAPRSMKSQVFGAPAHPSFNREATEQYMPHLMKGIGPGQMPVYRVPSR